MIDIKISNDELEGTEATFSIWLVSVGDQVKQGQPIAELETDKVAMEICAMETGVIESLLAKPGDNVLPEQSLGKISTTTSIHPHSFAKKDINSNHDSMNQSKILLEEKIIDQDSVSPAVRRLLTENNIMLNSIQGSGKGGRVTREDALTFIKSKKPSVKTENDELISYSKANLEQPKNLAPFESSIPVVRELKGTMHPHSTMRKSIANHMVNSLLETSPHVTSVFEMDMGNIIEHRKWHKKEYAELGVKLTFTAYFLAAMAKSVKAVPQVNAKFHQDALEIFSDINIGVGTALGDKGLVVPVVQQVQSMNLFQIATALNQQTEKARSGNLKPSDMKNGTLTISNYGVSGSLFATPIIINQPQVAILGIGKLEKRVVVEQKNDEDVMVIRPKCYVSLSIDHRALDAHQTNLYLSEFVGVIESWGS